MPTKSVAVRMPEELLDYLNQRAEKEHRTLSNLIIAILLDEKEREQEKKQPKRFLTES